MGGERNANKRVPAVLIMLVVVAALLALPRLLSSVAFPDWWGFVAFFGPYAVFRQAFKGERQVERSHDDEWQALAEEMGLKYRPRRPRKSPPYIYGSIDGHPVNVKFGRSIEIEGKFRAGLPYLDVRSRRKERDSGRDRPEIPTGDPDFDARFRVPPRGPGEALLAYLNPTRREVLIALDDVFDIDEVDSNELEVELRTSSPTRQEVREAIELVAMAVKVLDESASPQDRVVQVESPLYPQDIVRD